MVQRYVKVKEGSKVLNQWDLKPKTKKHTNALILDLFVCFDLYRIKTYQGKITFI